MNNEEIQALSVEELRDKVRLEQDNLQKLRFAHAISPLENPMRIRSSRKLVARMLTQLSAKQSEKAK